MPRSSASCSRPRSGRARSSTRTSRSSTPSPVPSSSASHSTARRSRASSVPGPSRKLRPRRSVGRPDLSPGRAALGGVGVSVGDGLPVVAVGVVNLSPESFHAGSVYTRDDDLLGAALGMVEAGAALIDVGARSTAPYLDAALDEAEERDRLVRAVELLARKLPVPISADTARLAPARAARAAGIPEERIVVDPGIGFFRDEGIPWHEWDARVLAGLGGLNELGRPVCVGVSRKSFIGAITGRQRPAERLAGSLAATAIAVRN